jgi:hypothetical protein
MFLRAVRRRRRAVELILAREGRHGLASGGLSQWFGSLAPHTRFEGHIPQSIVFPQPSPTTPHCAPSWSHVFGRQPQWLVTPPAPHARGAGHAPQCNIPPHPSDASPQSKPSAAQVVGVHGPAPHWLGADAPHTCIGPHMPHISVCPQPSDTAPHLAPSVAHVVGLHSHLVPLHDEGAAQLPQSRRPPQPSSTIPHSA